MPQGRSHTGSYMALINKLKDAGHQVSLYMEAYPDEMNFGLDDLILRIEDQANPFANEGYELFQWTKDFSVTSILFPYFAGSKSCEIVLEHHRDYFNRMVDTDFDLILTDTLFAVCGYGIATLNKAHNVLMSSTHIDSGSGSMRAYGVNFALTPRHFMPVHDAEFIPESFYYRAIGTFEWITNFILNHIIIAESAKSALAPILPNFSFLEYQKSAVSVLTDMPFDLIGPSPKTNELLDYGSYCPTPKPLTGKLLEFVSDPKSKGTILVAFGTILNWGRVPEQKFTAVLEAFNSLKDYRVVWSYNGKAMTMQPHIFASEWIPQVDVLYDNRTVLFFNHGGLKSLKEAICSSVPSVFMPMFAEQVRNGWLAKSKGYAEIFNKHELTKDNLLTTMKRVLENKSFTKNAARVTSFFSDKVVPPLSQGVHHINRLLKYGGRMPEFFYPRAIRRDYLSYFNLDIFVLPLIPIILVSLR
ncbi:hypothetical protein Q1695_002558 [Nippostrongylus brasiliensis]|nr:hypothetical protein Q1695_002558 [Nippostrongylus brasiliensis]